MTKRKFGPYPYGPYAAPSCMDLDDYLDPDNAMEADCWDWIEQHVDGYRWGWLRTKTPGSRHSTVWPTIWFEHRADAAKYREAWAERLWDDGSSEWLCPPTVIDRDGVYEENGRLV